MSGWSNPPEGVADVEREAAKASRPAADIRYGFDRLKAEITARTDTGKVTAQDRLMLQMIQFVEKVEGGGRFKVFITAHDTVTNQDTVVMRDARDVETFLAAVVTFGDDVMAKLGP